jgi:putative transcriptional regulator
MSTPKKTYRTDLLGALHQGAEDLHAIGAIDKATLRRFDLSCLTPVEPLAPEKIRAIRERAQMSQAIFARALNVTTSLVSKWERGDSKPGGASLKLLSLVAHKGIDAIL